ncbi:RES domain-containing protein [Listeria seeligeri]|uniref:RES family NAD+ phosphorylase n=1 Tax=Listeria seeligeri TaxID=1640 RepID=UPI0019450B15|nr:RES family NAD+ phosphorylase [Listeria seeligeri]MBM5696234.1 RES domain-containing protein [Listeria seeligeri]
MICCEKCFRDTEIITLIKSNNTISTCEICNKENVYIYDTDKNDALTPLFTDLIEIYSIKHTLPSGFPTLETNLLKNDIMERWDIFNELTSGQIQQILINICSSTYHDNPQMFEEQLGIPELYDNQFITKNSVLGDHTWNEFVDSIKRENRFHLDYFNKDIFSEFCKKVERPINKDVIYYRARINQGETEFKVNEMGVPPFPKVTSGRANPEGISVLYLSDAVKTTIYEVRAGANDVLSVGEFIAKKDLQIVDFTQFDKISPFQVSSGLQHFLINKKHLQLISNEIAKPIRKNDSSLEYIPTQYITDFIKSQGYEGVLYKSTLDCEGINLAIFNDKNFECMDVSQYIVKKINYEFKKKT